MTVVAEGVETADQHPWSPSLGCDSCQGFYFARPMTAAKLDTLIQQVPATGGGHLHLPLEAAIAST